ncbi:MAG TPA: heme-binding domain-containing protein [Oligoflexia bacterium]|nr:heme-binding domain-containing protein [Oligoflexia bacterium]
MKLRLAVIAIGFVLLCEWVNAHEPALHKNKETLNFNNKKSLKVDQNGFEIISNEPTKKQLDKINALYQKKVYKIFKKKCLDCHGSSNSKPWYAQIPGPKKLINNDIKEAKKHMDMSKGFPFKGHGAPVDDLDAIERVLKEDSMPPFRYKLVHWWSGVTAKEKSTIHQWIEESKKIIKIKKGK